MKLAFFQRPASGQAEIIREVAARRGVSAVMVEKDFWVSWILAVLFAHPELGGQLVFKGGTSLSKVFGVIDRFSEDIDLSVGPEFLGVSEVSLETPGSRRETDARLKDLEERCIDRVRGQFVPELERLAVAALGRRAGGRPWMEFQVDATTHSPVVLFHYPSHEPTGFEYLGRSVKLELGSLTDQRPVGLHAVKPWVAEEFPQLFPDFKGQLVTLELERTFWEKATILHAEYHREKGKPMRDRFSRHYSDLAALVNHPGGGLALARGDLCQRVAQWKRRFFAANWAHYELAKPGTFRLVPPDYRLAELENDYRAMRVMFIQEPPSFAKVLATVQTLENRINQADAADSGLADRRMVD